LQGTGGTNRYKEDNDTPTGVYDIPFTKGVRGNNTWISGGDRAAYGKNPRLALNGESGEIKDSYRVAIRIHGGRQEIYNEETGSWEEVKTPKLKKTHGCLRCYDEDIVTLKSITDKLIADDPEETAGTLTIIDDLVEKRDPSRPPRLGKLKYYLPEKPKKKEKPKPMKYF
jgi:hypothetical protein